MEKIIDTYIKYLSKILPTNYEFESWIPNCIECLQFAIDNEQLLNEKPELYKDTMRTLQLLQSWIVEEKEWAYIELRQKFKKHYSPEEVGKALKHLLTKLQQNKCVEESQPLEHKLKNININLINCETQGYKTPYEVLNELSEVWNNY